MSQITLTLLGGNKTTIENFGSTGEQLKIINDLLSKGGTSEERRLGILKDFKDSPQNIMNLNALLETLGKHDLSSEKMEESVELLSGFSLTGIKDEHVNSRAAATVELMLVLIKNDVSVATKRSNTSIKGEDLSVAEILVEVNTEHKKYVNTGKGVGYRHDYHHSDPKKIAEIAENLVEIGFSGKKLACLVGNSIGSKSVEKHIYTSIDIAKSLEGLDVDILELPEKVFIRLSGLDSEAAVQSFASIYRGKQEYNSNKSSNEPKKEIQEDDIETAYELADIGLQAAPLEKVRNPSHADKIVAEKIAAAKSDGVSGPT